MMLRVLPIFAFLLLAVVVSYAALPSEIYWNMVLPNTPIPKGVRELLRPVVKAGGDRISNSVNSGKEKEKNPNRVFLYNLASSEEDLNDPNVFNFFLEKDLHIGTNMNLYLTKTTTITRVTSFLPRHVAETIPFSSKKLSEIFNRLSVEPQSEEAELIHKTLKECEGPAQEGEDRFCVTSLETMIDFCTSKLEKDNVKVMETEVFDNDNNNNYNKQYIITSGVQKMVGDNSVICHGMSYAYPVFFCHATHDTRAYVIPLVGVDGTKAKAVAVCHTDTSKWNPKHFAFQVLKVKPGIVPICHFLSKDQILWI